MKKTLKFTVFCLKWFDKVNGNTYHSARIIRHRDGKVLYCPWRYGYGDQYRQTALEAMSKEKWIIAEPDKFWEYERTHGYPILWHEQHVTKKEMIKNWQV